ncbi:MAG: 4-(cytidine 5'-diphospho)-2-C-methyl-D-erythritol kinase, partial [Alphaproteobacteria bacterium]
MIVQKAPIKINLMLHVIKKYAQGCHHLQSLVTFLDKGDEVYLTPSKQFDLNIKGPFAKGLEIGGNLLLKASYFISNIYPNEQKASFTLVKNIPIASGMGGGSSDAAAAILGLLRMWGRGTSLNEREELIKKSGVLGADVPLCLANLFFNEKYFWLDGTGKEGTFKFLNYKKPLFILLVNPLIELSTKDVFYNRVGNFDKPILAPLLDSDFLKNTKNSLEEVAVLKLPIIKKILHRLKSQRGCFVARMTGSGPTCFGLFHEKHDLDIALKQM